MYTNIILFFLLCVSCVVYIHLFMNYIGNTLLDFKKNRKTIYFVSTINLYLIVLSHNYNLPLTTTYFIMFFLIVLELIIFTKIKFLPSFFFSTTFLLTLLSVECIIIALFSIYLKKPFVNIIQDDTYWLLSMVLTFIILIIEILLFKYRLDFKNLKSILSNRKQLLIITILYFSIFIYLLSDTILFVLDKTYANQLFFLINSTISLIIYFYIFIYSIRIASISHYADKINNLRVDFEEMVKSTNKLKNMAFNDTLTGCYTKDYIMSCIDVMLEKNKFPFCIAYIDLDKLKFVNDTYGHIEGDKYLKDISKTFLHLLRKTDFLARIGGDEFVIVFPDTTEQSADFAMNRIHKNIQEIQKQLKRSYKMSVSYGVVEVNAENKLSRDEIFIEADKRMYQMKMKRRNSCS